MLKNLQEFPHIIPESGTELLNFQYFSEEKSIPYGHYQIIFRFLFRFLCPPVFSPVSPTVSTPFYTFLQNIVLSCFSALKCIPQCPGKNSTIRQHCPLSFPSSFPMVPATRIIVRMPLFSTMDSAIKKEPVRLGRVLSIGSRLMARDPRPCAAWRHTKLTALRPAGQCPRPVRKADPASSRSPGR